MLMSGIDSALIWDGEDAAPTGEDAAAKRSPVACSFLRLMSIYDSNVDS